MMRRFLPLLLAILTGCAHAIVRHPPALVSIYEGAPEWLRIGSDAAKIEGTRWFLGVGQASLKTHEGRDVAETQARNEAARLAQAYLREMGAHWSRDSDSETEPPDVAALHQSLREFARSWHGETQVVDQWTSRDGSTLFVLARQDADALLKALDGYSGLNDRTREIVKARADSNFSELSKEEHRRVPAE